MLLRDLRFVLPLGVACAVLAPSCARPEPSAPPTAVTPAAALEGDVVGPNGRPVPGALVSVWAHFDAETGDPPFDVTSDAAGHFRFTALPGPRWAVTATAPGLAAAYSGVRATAKTTSRVTLRLGGAALVIGGTVRDEAGGPVSNARIIAATFSESEDEVYVTRTDTLGRYTLSLPGVAAHVIVADAPPRRRASIRVEGASTSADLALAAKPAPRPSDAELIAWLRATALPLTAGPAELSPAEAKGIAAIVHDARVIGLGEATHGSAELGDWRRRFFETLVRDDGVTVLAMVSPPAVELDDYVTKGEGDAKRALGGLTTWPTDTTETLALVEWMRAYDADPGHASKLHVEGIDIYTPPAVAPLLAYLSKVDPASVAEARRALAPFAEAGCDATYPKLPAEDQARARAAVGTLLSRIDAQRASYVALSSKSAWARARQLARLFQEAESSYRDETLRDRYVAENVHWLVARYPPGTRFVLAAHDSHIASERHGLSELGALLRNDLGEQYVAIGFSFAEGELRALDRREGARKRDALGVFTVGRPPGDTLDAALALAGLPAFAVDLRRTGGAVEAWLRSPQRMHSVRGWFSGESAAWETFEPRAAFDALVYVERISPSHPLAHP